MIRSEKLECLILGLGLEIPGLGEEGRTTSVGHLCVVATEKCGNCSMDEVVDALYSLQTDHVELKKYVSEGTETHVVRFKRNDPKWREFFNSYFNIRVLPAGRRRFEMLSEQLPQDDDGKFARMAIAEARKSVPEPDGRPHPRVGAVVVKNGQVLSVAHRGEAAGNHAEFIALEKKLSDEAVAGATVYTTLEPCTTRNHPKIPCATRLIERKVARVVIGMHDPDERITGRGWLKLRSAGIVVESFPPDLVPEAEELNREFTRFCEQETHPSHSAASTSRPEIIVTCEWPSKSVSGSSLDSMLNRRLELKNLSDKVALNVQILDIDLPKGTAQFDIVPLIEKSEPKPIVCQVKRSDGFGLLNAWDLESLIAAHGEGISLAGPIIRTPIVVRYQDTSKSVWESVSEIEYDLFLGKGQVKFKEIRKGPSIQDG